MSEVIAIKQSTTSNTGGGLKDLYEVGEIPPVGHVPEKMYAWSTRKERHGPPDEAMQIEVLPTWKLDSHDVLVFVMAAGVNYNGVWASLGIPISTLDGHKNRLATAEDRVCVPEAPPALEPVAQKAEHESTTAPLGKPPAGDTNVRRGGGFWSSPWPYVIGGIAVAGAGAAVYFGTRPPENVSVGQVGVRSQ